MKLIIYGNKYNVLSISMIFTRIFNGKLKYYHNHRDRNSDNNNNL